jgi:hypothetical protein
MKAGLAGTLLQRGLQRRYAVSKLASQFCEALSENGFEPRYPLLELRDFVHLSSLMRT